MQASWLKLSIPVLTENFVILQDIGFQKNEEFNLIQNLNFGVQITTWFLSLSFFSFTFIFFLISMRRLIARNMLMKAAFNLKKVASSYMKLSKRFSLTLSSMSIFIVMFNLYLWLFMVLITNTTQTNKVVIIITLISVRLKLSNGQCPFVGNLLLMRKLFLVFYR